MTARFVSGYAVVIPFTICATACGTARSSAPVPLPIHSAGEILWPRPPDPARIRYVGSISRPSDIGARRPVMRRLVDALTGRQETRVLQPFAVAADTSDRVYVTDLRARGVHVFDLRRRSHAFLSRIGDLQLRAPTGVAPDGLGRLYVADAELGAVFAVDSRGRELWRLVGFARPSGLALHPVEQQLYVVETQGHRVHIVNTAGRVEHSFGGRGDSAGEFNFPTNVTVGPDGEVYITDSMNSRVQMFGPSGEFLAAFGRPGDAVGDLPRPKGISVDSEGHIYVVDGLYDVVNVYGRTGRLLLSFGGPGHGPGQFWLAAGMAIDARDRILVADTFNSRVQVFQYLPAVP